MDGIAIASTALAMRALRRAVKRDLYMKQRCYVSPIRFRVHRLRWLCHRCDTTDSV